MEKSDYKKLGLPAVRVVDVKGYEFAKVGRLPSGWMFLLMWCAICCSGWGRGMKSGCCR